MKEQDAGELSGGIEIGPVDPGATVARVEDMGLEGWVQRSQESEVGCAVGVPVSRMYGGSLRPSLPLLARHCSLNLSLFVLGLGFCPNIKRCSPQFLPSSHEP